MRLPSLPIFSFFVDDDERALLLLPSEERLFPPPPFTPPPLPSAIAYFDAASELDSPDAKPSVPEDAFFSPSPPPPLRLEKELLPPTALLLPFAPLDDDDDG